MIKGIEHIAVCSKDTKALKEWYERVLGFREVYNNGKGTYFVAAPDNSMIEIMAAAELKGKGILTDSGIRHFALSISPEDFDRGVQKIRAEKVEIVTEVVEKNGVKTFFFRDIDGNIFHFIAREKPLI